MRVVSSVFLLSILLLNLFGFYFAFSVQQNEIQKEMFAHTGNAHVLSLSKIDFDKIVWSSKNKEMRFNGQLYDVSKIEISNTGVNLYVEEDTVETKLVDDFIAVFASQTDKATGSSPIKILLQHVMQEFTFNAAATLFHPSLSFVSMTEKASSFSSFVSIGQSPPPDGFHA